MDKVIDTGFATLTFVNDLFVEVRVKAGVEVDRPQVEEMHRVIDRLLPGDHGLIIVREEDYSVVPVAVFNVLNNLSHLKAIAIVISRLPSATLAAIDKALANKPLEIFDNLAGAREWLEATLAAQENAAAAPALSPGGDPLE